MNKRLFIAFPVAIDSSLSAALKRTRISAQKKEMEFNWTPEANFHVTLSFLGNTPESRLPELESLIREVAVETPPLATSLRGMGAFPDERHMRVLWVGVRKSRALSELQSRLEEKLTAAGFVNEDRDYSPHLTIGRLRKSRAGGDLLSPYVRTSFGDVAVSAITLYESLLHGGHPVYNPLLSAALTGQPAEEEVES